MVKPKIHKFTFQNNAGSQIIHSFICICSDMHSGWKLKKKTVYRLECSNQNSQVINSQFPLLFYSIDIIVA